MLIWTLMLLGLPAEDVARTVARVEKAYSRAGGISAEFTQTYYDSMRLRGGARSESGRLWVAPDGRARWTYLRPERKEFVFDGATAYFYEPEQAQVTVLRNFRHSPLATSTSFLWGQGEVGGRFAVAACPPAPADDGPGPPPMPPDTLCAALTPPGDMPQVKEVRLGLDPDALRIRRSRVVDPVGNVMELVFSNVQFGKMPAPELFRFDVPDGVSVLEPDAEP